MDEAMMNNKENKDLDLIAMEILLHAGNGRFKVVEAFEKTTETDYVKAKKLMDEAYEEIKKAHEVQTRAIQSIAACELEEEYSVLFSHAQDTLMTVYSEYNVSKRVLELIGNMEERLQKLEKTHV